MAKAKAGPVAVDVEDAHLKDLVPDPENRREHTARNIGMVEQAMHEVGAARSVVIDEDNKVLAGNGAIEGAANAGITKVRIIEADGDTLIAVRRRGLTADQKRRLAIYDNRSAELARWNLEQLAKDQAAGLPMTPFFTKDELADLAERMEAVAAVPTRPDFHDLIDTFEESNGCAPKGDANWLFIEFYNAPEMFEQTRAIFPAEAMRGKHELRRDIFLEMVKLYADKHANDAAGGE